MQASQLPPGAGPASPDAAGAAVLIWNDVQAPGRDLFYQWHDKEHMPERLGLPGFVRGRRYAAAGASPEWFTIYETASLDTLVSPAYLERLNSPTPATTQTLKFFENTARSVCDLRYGIGQSTGGFVVAVRFDAVQGGNDSAMTAIAARVLPALLAQPGVLACKLYGADGGASRIDTAESKTREFDIPSWVVMVETSHQAAAERAIEFVKAVDWEAAGARARSDFRAYALEICLSQ
jgi:hypothetical protein